MNAGPGRMLWLAGCVLLVACFGCSQEPSALPDTDDPKGMITQQGNGGTPPPRDSTGREHDGTNDTGRGTGGTGVSASSDSLALPDVDTPQVTPTGPAPGTSTRSDSLALPNVDATHSGARTTRVVSGAGGPAASFDTLRARLRTR